ncbi:NEDD4-binding protein 2-like 1 like protein [Argiope bruennichi]|uniref:NEDD4-binding protein 2-like 1 like protein n=1 Tax=Argiope bruennichi TaxID=94029 RepID=A0A8T0FWI8_ARGBR|nr:NEDD4-binding protein 2-like 1 like protein [Argiope bruennichi]
MPKKYKGKFGNNRSERPSSKYDGAEIFRNEAAVYDDTEPRESLQRFMEMFHGKIDDNVISMIYSECFPDVDQCLESLLNLSCEVNTQRTDENINISSNELQEIPIEDTLPESSVSENAPRILENSEISAFEDSNTKLYENDGNGTAQGYDYYHTPLGMNFIENDSSLSSSVPNSFQFNGVFPSMYNSQMYPALGPQYNSESFPNYYYNPVSQIDSSCHFKSYASQIKSNCNSPKSNQLPFSSKAISSPKSGRNGFKWKSDEFKNVMEKIKKGSRILIILRGLPGSGKSTLAKKLKSSGVVFSTDDYFYKHGKYAFDPSVLDEAHYWNQNRAREALLNGITPVVIDNTNTEVWEMLPYVKMGKKFNYEIVILEPNTPWKFKPKELAFRNKHGVHKEKITKMLARYQHNITLDHFDTASSSSITEDPVSNPKKAVDNFNLMPVVNDINEDMKIDNLEELKSLACEDSEDSQSLGKNDAQTSDQELTSWEEITEHDDDFLWKTSSLQNIPSQFHCNTLLESEEELKTADQHQMVLLEEKQITCHKNLAQCNEASNMSCLPAPDVISIGEPKSLRNNLHSFVDVLPEIEDHISEENLNSHLADLSSDSDVKSDDCISQKTYPHDISTEKLNVGKAEKSLCYNENKKFLNSHNSELKKNLSLKTISKLNDLNNFTIPSNHQLSKHKSTKSFDDSYAIQEAKTKNDKGSETNLLRSKFFSVPVLGNQLNISDENFNSDLTKGTKHNSYNEKLFIETDIEIGKENTPSDLASHSSPACANSSWVKRKNSLKSISCNEKLFIENELEIPEENTHSNLELPINALKNPSSWEGSESHFTSECSMTELSDYSIIKYPLDQNDSINKQEQAVENEGNYAPNFVDPKPQRDEKIANMIFRKNMNENKLSESISTDQENLEEFVEWDYETESETKIENSDGNFDDKKELFTPKPPRNFLQSSCNPVKLTLNEDDVKSNDSNECNTQTELKDFILINKLERNESISTEYRIIESSEIGQWNENVDDLKHSDENLDESSFCYSLEELFGPVTSVGSVSTESSNIIVQIDLEFAKLIHCKWKDSVQNKGQSNNENVDTKSKKMGVKLSGEKIKKDKKIVNAVKKNNGEPMSLSEIMEMEQAVEHHKKEKLRKDRDIVTKKNRNKLYNMFPGADPTALDEIFESNNCCLETSIKALEEDLGNSKTTGYGNLTLKECEGYAEILNESIDNWNKSNNTSDFASNDWNDWVHNGETDYLENNPKATKEITTLPVLSTVTPEAEALRGKAVEHYLMQQKCIQKSSNYYQRGMKPVASFYAQDASEHRRKFKEANKAASELIAEQRNAGLGYFTLDLHGLYVQEAIPVLEKFLRERKLEIKRRPQGSLAKLTIITGQGLHSMRGPKLRPSVIEYLRRTGYFYSEIHVGVLEVYLNSDGCSSASRHVPKDLLITS